MSDLFHVYCDESCHLENDRARAMVLGAIWCEASHRQQLARKIKSLIKAHGLPAGFEIKWVKVSPAREAFYRAVIDLFFDEPGLHFRALLVPEKAALNHSRFGQSHDQFYYKMWYHLLNKLISPEDTYRIFLDIKDTQGQAKIDKLHNVLCNANYDFDRAIIRSIELVHSHDVYLLQLADLLIGALAYAARDETGSAAKMALVEHVRLRSGLSLRQSSLMRAGKFNLFVWRPQV